MEVQDWGGTPDRSGPPMTPCRPPNPAGSGPSPRCDLPSSQTGPTDVYHSPFLPPPPRLPTPSRPTPPAPPIVVGDGCQGRCGTSNSHSITFLHGFCRPVRLTGPTPRIRYGRMVNSFCIYLPTDFPYSNVRWPYREPSRDTGLKTKPFRP